jgi:hypothetical protein
MCLSHRIIFAELCGPITGLVRNDNFGLGQGRDAKWSVRDAQVLASANHLFLPAKVSNFPIRRRGRLQKCFSPKFVAVSHESQLWNEFTGKSGHTVDLRLKFNGHNHILIELNSAAYSQIVRS